MSTYQIEFQDASDVTFNNRIYDIDNQTWVGFTDDEKHTIIDMIKTEYFAAKQRYLKTGVGNPDYSGITRIVYNLETPDPIVVNDFIDYGAKHKNLSKTKPSVIIRIMKYLGMNDYSQYFLSDYGYDVIANIIYGLNDNETIENAVNIANTIGVMKLKGKYKLCKQIVINPRTQWFNDIMHHARLNRTTENKYASTELKASKELFNVLYTAGGNEPISDDLIMTVLPSIVDSIIVSNRDGAHRVSQPLKECKSYVAGSFTGLLLSYLASDFSYVDTSSPVFIARIKALKALANLDSELDVKINAAIASGAKSVRTFVMSNADFRKIVLHVIKSAGTIPVRILAEDFYSNCIE